MKGVVASDLEGTLTTGATWQGLGRYHQQGRGKLAYRLFFLSRLPTYLLAKLKLRDEAAFKERWVTDLPTLFQGRTSAEVAQAAEWVIKHELWPKRRQDVIAELQGHMAAGRRVILASGTYQEVLEAFAKRIGAEALGTGLEYKDGLSTGRLTGEVSVGSTKAQRLQALLAEEELYSAYGDTEADIEMLMLAEYPVAVYPDEVLRRVAQERGWRILSG